VPVRATHVLLAAALLGLPAEAHGRTLELERGRLNGAVKVVSDSSAGGGRAVALSGPGSVRRRFVTRHGFSQLLLRARALPCMGGRPRITLRLDGGRIGTRVVRSRRFKGVRFRVVAAAGPKTAEVRLANPGRGRSCRRTAVVDSLRVVERPRPSSSRPALTAAPAGPVPPPPPAPPVPEGGYQNPVFASPGAPDPGVLDVGSAHSDYFVFHTGGRFPMLRSPDLVNWTPAGTALQARPGWAASTGDWNPWAPSVIERDGPCPGAGGPRCFVMFHVARHGTLVPPTNCIGVAVSPLPEGPYRSLGPLTFTDGRLDASDRPPGCGDDAGYSNIDPAPFVDDDGQAYLYLSTGRRCETPAPNAECPWDRWISVIPLEDDLLTASGPRQPLFNATTPGWEVGSFGPVVENPWVVKRGSTYLMLYSGGAYTGRYGMGYATSNSPIGPYVKSASNPVLAEAEGVLSPGGGMPVTGPRGGDWLVYHGRRGNRANPRELRIDRLHFPTESTLTVDGPTSAPQPGAP
jgi:Glycosyl hydrolases family 43